MQTTARNKAAALEEAKAAVEELVLAGGHAAELLPRSPDVVIAQVTWHSACCCYTSTSHHATCFRGLHVSSAVGRLVLTRVC